MNICIFCNDIALYTYVSTYMKDIDIDNIMKIKLNIIIKFIRINEVLQ